MSDEAPRFFWLHIKKAGGQSARAAFRALYVETDRSRMPACFTALPAAEWNDALNNYRLPLGRWQFRRSEFARRFLWPEAWEGMLRVAFARHPLDRAVSMFQSFADPYGGRPSNLRRLTRYVRALGVRRLPVTRRSAFSAFLDLLELQESFRTRSIYEPCGLHFSTHTNPMANDVLDDDGRLNLSHLFRLECFDAAVRFCHRELGVPQPRVSSARRNVSRAPRYEPTPAQRRRVEQLFARDFDLYENALTL